MRILYFHVPDIQDYMIETRDFMKELSSMGFKIVDIPTPSNLNEMYNGLFANWGFEDLIIFGQDNVCTKLQLQNLIQCKYPVCAIPCIQSPKSTGLKGYYQNMISDGVLHEFDDKREWCTGIMGTGISRFTLDAQRSMLQVWESFHYQSFDSTLSRIAHRAGIEKFHLHYPLHKHNKV